MAACSKDDRPTAPACTLLARPSPPTPPPAMSSVTDRTPLLENGNGAHPPKPFFARLADSFAPEGQPSWLRSYKFFFFGSYLNVLLLFVPLSVISHFLDWDAALRFSFSFIAIMPLAAVRSLLSIHSCLTSGFELTRGRLGSSWAPQQSSSP